METHPDHKLVFADDEPAFPFADAEWAAGATCGNLHSQVARGTIVLNDRDTYGLGTGSTCLLSYNSTLQLALFVALRAIGIAPVPAGFAARCFTCAGQEGRRPGQLFPIGRTVLLISFGMELDGSLFVAGANVYNSFTDSGSMSDSPCHVWLDVGEVKARLNERLSVIVFQKRPGGKKQAPPRLVA